MVNNDIFFPIRYEKSRAFVNKFVELLRKKTDKEIYAEQFTMKIQNLLFEQMVECENKYPPPFSISEQNFNLKLSKELNLFGFYHKWQNSGRNIFHFTKELLTLFENTEVGDVPFNLIQYPFKSFYISFADLDKKFGFDNIGNEYYLDGVFIVKDFAKKNQIDFFFNSFIKDATSSKDWLFGSYSSLICGWYRINYSEKENNLNASGFIDKFLNENPHEGATEATDMFFSEMIKLSINSLCYISSKQEKEIKEFPKDTPQYLIDNYSNAKTKHKKEILKTELSKKGYSKVSFLGQAYKKNDKVELSSGKTTSVHWRRGHWRNQPFGQNLNETKLVWIKPTIVNKEKGEPKKGRIYNV